MKNLMHIIVISILVSSCSDDSIVNKNCLTGSGDTIEEIREVDSFQAISATIVGSVTVTQGSPQLVRIVTHPNIMAELRTQVVSNELIIDFDQCLGDIEKFDVFITMPEISGMALSGVGNLATSNSITSQNLSVSLSGVGDISLKGEADQFECFLSGVGDLKAFDLTTNTSKIVVSGVGDAETTVNNDLQVIVSGVGNVYYKGHPTINSTISGTGNLIDSN